jgi:RNA polymerase sigma-70 factor, ECF subfamily
LDNTTQIISACLKGDRKHQKVLFDMLYGYMKNICFRYLQDKHDLNDAVQEAFILLFKNLEQFDPLKGNLKAWAGKIGIRSALMHNRKVKPHNQLHDTQVKQMAIPADAIAKMDEQKLLDLIALLDDDYRTVFMMHTVDGYDHKEIAEILGIDESLSRKRLSRARQKLQEWISPAIADAETTQQKTQP